ncbi:MAG: CPBP family intramembrane metalloprotease [Hungatella sp.]|nr:CPBP family intramembrane metalloprotease [Hungatella sp.]
MTDKKIIVQFTVLTFSIAYLVSGALIALGQFGYSVHNWVYSLQQFVMNIPFAIYILSPAIASYIVLKKNNKIADLKEWLKTVFYVKNNLSLYLFVSAGLALYFLIHLAVSGRTEMALPFYTFFLSLPGNLIIGGLEESGWMYILQPELDKKYGFVLSSVFVGIIWILWHIPLFFIPGTNHGEGLINFWMFAVQLTAFRFFNGAIYKISGKGGVFMCVLFHTMFNAASPIFGTMTMTWAGTVAANAVIVLVSIVSVVIHGKKSRQIV